MEQKNEVREVAVHYNVTLQEGKSFLNESLGVSSSSKEALIDLIHKGININVFERVSKAIGVSSGELAAVTDITTRTLARRKKEGRLHSAESDRVVRVALLFEQVVELFEGDLSHASLWFKSPKKVFGGASPLEFSDTEVGAREVEELIGRLEHGVFS